MFPISQIYFFTALSTIIQIGISNKSYKDNGIEKKLADI